MTRNFWKIEEKDQIKFNLNVFDKNNNLIDELTQKDQDIILDQKNSLHQLLLNHEILNKEIIIDNIKNETQELKYVFEIIDFKKANDLNCEIENKNLKQNLEIKNKNVEDLLQKVKHLEYQLKLAIEDVKKAKESRIIERFTMPEEEIKNIKQYALQQFLEEFLDPYLTLKIAIESALNNNDLSVQNYAKGFTMVVNLIDEVLKNKGLSIIQPLINSEYDPETSKIIEQIVDNSLQNNTVIKIKQNGYKLFDRVIKPALVITSKKIIHKNKQNNKKRQKNL
ncbi:nucleotide exchange factor GrpE [Mycoplasma sp. 1018B]|uniref:nucleotide exchange factor GrpE n=1 Tax=Mycoplasma sp. 1018B TaxID=2967302 RepID=UPI00211C9847|nr:nucleotide exchange factor GrpE [Mycoplasma sp. 1018B]UUM19171.1 nucleotide exchange factor GrpE [Mycoplasma sp. 1018B]